MRGLDKILQLMKEENDRLNAVLGECQMFMAPLRAIILENYLDAIKTTPGFPQEVYQELKKILRLRMIRDTAGPGEDPEEVKRRMEVRKMLAELIRS